MTQTDKTAQPTPGPWTIDEGDGSFVVNAEGIAVAEVSNPAWPRETEEANAHLIAAAPRMLEMLRDRVTAPSGEVICTCRNRNAVNAGLERACWYCEARALLREIHGEGQ